VSWARPTEFHLKLVAAAATIILHADTTRRDARTVGLDFVPPGLTTRSPSRSEASVVHSFRRATPGGAPCDVTTAGYRDNGDQTEEERREETAIFCVFRQPAHAGLTSVIGDLHGVTLPQVRDVPVSPGDRDPALDHLTVGRITDRHVTSMKMPSTVAINVYD
jgi:hypothetical protein